MYLLQVILLSVRAHAKSLRAGIFLYPPGKVFDAFVCKGRPFFLWKRLMCGVSFVGQHRGANLLRFAEPARPNGSSTSAFRQSIGIFLSPLDSLQICRHGYDSYHSAVWFLYYKWMHTVSLGWVGVPYTNVCKKYSDDTFICKKIPNLESTFQKKYIIIYGSDKQ